MLALIFSLMCYDLLYNWGLDLNVWQPLMMVYFLLLAVCSLKIP